MATDSNDPTRETDAGTPVEVELFEFDPAQHTALRPRAVCENCGDPSIRVSAFHEIDVCLPCAAGWYWRSSVLLADGDAVGPFASLRDASEAALTHLAEN